jgi:nucleotide-binding universal stress UspA family protein
VFGRIVCLVDGSEASSEAAAQALVLARHAAELKLLAADGEAGGHALAAATRIAADRPGTTVGHAPAGANAAQALVTASAGADLLVVGSGGGAGVLIGSTASAALHTAPLPVLVARPAPEPGSFPMQILVATDGSEEARRGVALGGRIARAHGSRLALIRVHDGRRESPAAVADEAAGLRQTLGADPAVLEEYGEAAPRIVRASGDVGASLLVIGSRGLGRARTLGSVGERVAHEAPCSVLVLRGDASP